MNAITITDTAVLSLLPEFLLRPGPAGAARRKAGKVIPRSIRPSTNRPGPNSSMLSRC
jgi:hypothetical protein